MDPLYIVLFVLLVLSGFFSGIETALISLSTVKINSLLAEKRKGAEALNRIKSNPHRLIITILIGNNIVNIAASSIATVLATNAFGNTGVGVATGVMTFLILVFGEITPKSIAIQHTETISLLVARPIELLGQIMYPIITFLEKITGVVIKLFGASEQKGLTEEELHTMVILAVREGVLTKDVARIMQNVLKFPEKKVMHIMTPDTRMAMIDSQKKLKDVLDYVIKTDHSTYPAFEKSRNNVVGYLHIDDILIKIKEKKLDAKVSSILKKAYFIPETKKINDLLKELSPYKHPMAIIVDEFGGVVGLVTLEDILEEIVGNIFDKSLRSTEHIITVDSKTIEADAQASIEQVENKLHVGLSSLHFSTIAGFLQEKLGKIPKIGDEVSLKNIKIIVDEADAKKVKRVKIIRERIPLKPKF